MQKRLFFGFAAASVLAASAASAVEVSGNVALVNDYSFRGWSQTMRGPALQAGFDLALPSGFYVGTWASNIVDSDEDNGVEVDLYVGWSGDISEAVSLDLSAIRFNYSGTDLFEDYQEFGAALSFGEVTVSLYYSPEYLGVEDVSFFYPSVSYDKDFDDTLSASVAVGYNKASEDGVISNSDGYVDYSANLVYHTGIGLDVTVGLVGTNNKKFCGNDCEWRPIFSLSKDF